MVDLSLFEREWNLVDWVKREHSKSEIDRSGELLVKWWGTPGAETTTEIAKAYVVAQNWRTSHELPLNVFQATLRVRAKRIEPGVIVAQRLKRFSSMMNKLCRETHMKLSQMQDLGGCRAILSDIPNVYQLYDIYRGGEQLIDTGSLKCHDYIREPKVDGYRGIHIVGRYSPRLAVRDPWKGNRIEIQLRTKLQHAFATAVETVTTFTGAGLKFGAGPPEWRRFFSLMGSALSFREGTNLVPDTPTSEKRLMRELRKHARQLKVRHRLEGWTHALKTLRRKNIEGFKWLLLVLDIEHYTFEVSGFADRSDAARTLDKIESENKPGIDAVLVWVRSIRDLRAAYPNYYADTREFLKALDFALKGQQ